MKANQETILKDLVLIGGGHSHVAVLKSFGMKPIPGVRLTVIARDVQTPYSGMLPGYVAGHYSYDEAHIDLRPLCQFASSRLYHDEAVCIDTGNKKVICADRPPVTYDLLSINIGSRPEIASVPGASDHTTPVKPINRFVDRWHRLVDRVLQQPGPHRIGVVGAGPAGVEILLAIQFRLRQLLNAERRGGEELEFHLVSKSERIIPAFQRGVGQRFERVLQQRDVNVYRGVAATRAGDGELALEDGRKLELDEILWVTGASAPAWLKESGLDVDDDGFVTVHSSLQSTSHEDIFAAGDVAHVVNHPRPKAGVFAVRQGKPLARNLRRALLGQPLKPFAPQSTMLALISTGDRYAVAVKARWQAEGRRLWVWKDWIDRRWMRKYSQLPEMAEDKTSALAPGLADRDTLKEISAIAMRCGGCGAKVGANVLTRALSKLQPAPRDDILIGLHAPDDAAVVEVPAGKVMVHTVDYFRSFIDDPYIFGQIAANHSLSDIFAMGAAPQSALAIATVPYGIENKVEDTLSQLMAGAMKVLNEADTALAGGHTSEGAELALGFSVNGLADRSAILRKSGMQPGDRLILTKPLGTGTLFAADMQQKAKGRWIADALQSMLQSNRAAASCVYAHGATACTDITGFGLLGHMVEMIKPSAVDVEIDLEALPVIEGALETVRQEIFSSLQPANIRLRRAIHNMSQAVASERYPLVFDPQTSGGLLASIPADQTEACLAALQQQGYDRAAVIGRVLPESGHLEPLTLNP
ncbi:MAG: selenide, water dikinase SelD [Gammaproteobacteria bacterium]